MEITWQNHISVDEAVLLGKPVIKGTRIAVELILELLAKGWSEADLLQNYPILRSEDIRAALFYAHDVIGKEHVYPAV